MRTEKLKWKVSGRAGSDRNPETLGRADCPEVCACNTVQSAVALLHTAGIPFRIPQPNVLPAGFEKL